MKAALRRVAARTVDALHEACGPVLAASTAQDAAGFFRHCGYRPLRLPPTAATAHCGYRPLRLPPTAATAHCGYRPLRLPPPQLTCKPL